MYSKIALAIYDDRLEAGSSGPLHFGLTAADLFAPHESLLWNPLIARVFYRRGVIESWGRGTIKMVELTQQAGLPAPEIEYLKGGVTVRFRPSRYLPPQLVRRDINERQRSILGLLAGSPDGMALRHIHAELGADIGERQVRVDLATLRVLGLAVHSGHGGSARWKRL